MKSVKSVCVICGVLLKIETFCKRNSDLIGPKVILKIHEDILHSTLRSAFKIETSDHSVLDVLIAKWTRAKEDQI